MGVVALPKDALGPEYIAMLQTERLIQCAKPHVTPTDFRRQKVVFTELEDPQGTFTLSAGGNVQSVITFTTMPVAVSALDRTCGDAPAYVERTPEGRAKVALHGALRAQFVLDHLALPNRRWARAMVELKHRLPGLRRTMPIPLNAVSVSDEQSPIGGSINLAR